MSWKMFGMMAVSLLMALALAGCASSGKDADGCAHHDGMGMVAGDGDHGCCSPEGAAMICPVSKKGIKEGKGVVLQHEGKEITFCCERCLTAFKKDPEKYTK